MVSELLGHGSPDAFFASQSSIAVCKRAMPFLASAIALSHPLNLSLTVLSRLLIILPMKQTSDYRSAYEAAKKELTDLLSLEEQIRKRLVVVRQSIQTLATLCESEGVEVDPSDEAAGMLEDSTLADEIRAVLAAHQGVPLRPLQIKSELERLGRDLSSYKNPQATIHMVLKRMAESNETTEQMDSDGKLVYMNRRPTWVRKLTIDNSTPLDTARDRFVEAHKKRLAREKDKRK